MKAIWVIEAKYIEGFKLFLKFSDGLTGIVDLENVLRGSIFEPLQDKSYFKQFQLNSWTLEWPNGADLAPEFLYDLISQPKGVSKMD